jgi:leucyl aminopeptidase
MKLQLQSQNDSSKTANTKGNRRNSTLVVFARAAKDSLKFESAELQKALSYLKDDKTFTGKHAETVFFREYSKTAIADHQHLLVVGLGEKPDSEACRAVAATVLGSLKAHKVAHTCIMVDGLAAGKKDFASHLQAFTEGLFLSDYNFDELKTGKDKDEEGIAVVLKSAHGADAALKAAFNHGVILAECQNFSRRLGDMPGNLMTPTILADEAVEAAKGTGIKVEVWDKARIKKERMGGLLGVAQGSAQEPRFIIYRYNGAAKTKKPLVFVGKGLTFDTGGISIKPSAAMEEMKYDMCGGANVLGAVLAIARLKLKVNVIALVPSTENMPGSQATKPGDIHTARNGKTFEVNNTDAEGRLILSDALCYASEQNPEMIIDAATLTGAIVMALGNLHTGVFTRSDDMAKKIQKAADESGEWVWRMPLTDFHVKDMKGTFADLSNISSSKGAGSATAAAYLEQFVGEGIPWAHFDIAGTAWAIGGRWGYHPKKGASGIMVRTFVELAKLY